MKEGPSGSAIRSLIPSHRKLLWVKSHGGERCGNAGTMITEGTVERGECKRTVSEVSRADELMSKPWGNPSRGISSGDVLIRPERHPACRRREAQPGSCTECENLTGDGKGKGASGSNREAESTDAPERGGLLRSSDEAGVVPVERRERVTDVGSGQPATGGT